MRYAWTLAQRSGGALLLRDRTGGTASVVTAGQAARRLRRSRRQVYRQLAQGLLESRGKFLGEHLISAGSVERLAARPAARQRLPRALQPLFPEHAIGKLNAGRDRVLVLSRVLEDGGWAEARWLARRYPAAEIRRFLAEDGPRLLSPRALALWSLTFGAAPAKTPGWRRGEPWEARS